MNLLKFIFWGAYIFSMCGCAADAKISDETSLAYDKQNHMLLIGSSGSAKYVKTIKLDLQRDTLLICTISIKLKPLFKMNRSYRKSAMYAIKLYSNVEFVKMGSTLCKLSEINENSIESGFPVLIVFPQKFPIVIR